jgi:hypothetical protein
MQSVKRDLEIELIRSKRDLLTLAYLAVSNLSEMSLRALFTSAMAFSRAFPSLTASGCARKAWLSAWIVPKAPTAR